MTTNVELGKKLDVLTGEIKDLRGLLVDVAVNKEKLDAQEKDIERLEGRVNKWSSINSLGAMAGIIMSFFFGPKT